MERLVEDDSIYYEEELMVARAKTGDKRAQEFVIKKYKNLVRSRARSYFLIGADREDIVQEGMIGLFKAIRDYQPDKMSSFRSFADLCVKRQIITAIKTATRQKHMPLNSYVSLNKPLFDEESDRTLYDLMTNNKELNPEHLIIKQEEWHTMSLQMGKVLSDLEWQVLSAYIDGKTYQEIAKDMNRHIKSIDNALQRVKKKLEKFVDIE
jgi:RNA polymerase sporulation-specific sigma factor